MVSKGLTGEVGAVIPGAMRCIEPESLGWGPTSEMAIRWEYVDSPSILQLPAKSIRSTACLSNSGVCGYCRDALPGVVIIRYGNLTPIIRPAIAPPRVRYPAPRKPDRPSLIVAYNHVHNPVENCPNFDLFSNLTF